MANFDIENMSQTSCEDNAINETKTPTISDKGVAGVENESEKEGAEEEHIDLEGDG